MRRAPSLGFCDANKLAAVKEEDGEAAAAADISELNTRWRWRDAFPYLAMHTGADSVLDRMDDARVAQNPTLSTRLAYCQFLCSLVQHIRKNDITRSDVRLVFRCEDVITDCINVELLFNVQALFNSQRIVVATLCNQTTPPVTKMRALDEAHRMNEAVGCYRVLKDNRVVGVPQLETTYDCLDRLVNTTRVLHLFLLALTSLGCIDASTSPAAKAREAVSFAVAFFSAHRDLTDRDREGLIEPADVRWLQNLAHKTWGDQLLSQGRFRAARDIYALMPDLATEELNATRLIHHDVRGPDEGSVAELPRFMNGGLPLSSGIAPMAASHCKLVFEPKEVT